MDAAGYGAAEAGLVGGADASGTGGARVGGHQVALAYAGVVD